jgi:hypothetical protein
MRRGDSLSDVESRAAHGVAPTEAERSEMLDFIAGRNRDLERIEQIKSPVARACIKSISDAAYSGRITGDQVEILGLFAQALADKNDMLIKGLDEQEDRLVKAFRRLSASQKQGALMLLDAVQERPDKCPDLPGSNSLGPQ